jgi:hypothetical protein
MPKPEGYPLPWCDALDGAYWQVNMHLVMEKPGWREWQAQRPMHEIIPAIDELIAAGKLRPLATENNHDQ